MGGRYVIIEIGGKVCLSGNYWILSKLITIYAISEITGDRKDAQIMPEMLPRNGNGKNNMSALWFPAWNQAR